MPRKTYPDGRGATEAEALEVMKSWDKHISVRDLARDGKRLLLDIKGGHTVLPSLQNVKLNKTVVLELAQSMASRSRLSADHVDTICVMTVAWYEAHSKEFEEVKGFDKQTWAFKDAWALHKIFTMMRQKVTKDECPRELRISFRRDFKLQHSFQGWMVLWQLMLHPV